LDVIGNQSPGACMEFGATGPLPNFMQMGCRIAFKRAAVSRSPGQRSSSLTASMSKASGSNSPPTHSTMSSCSGWLGLLIASRKLP
jgi:hypothetical protein